MSKMLSDLLEDPLFQLNALLWLAQPLPVLAEIVPLFHAKGFTVYAIAPSLGLPPDVRLAAQEAGIDVQERVRPDVVLANEGDGKFLVTECKKSSFGTESTTAEQSRSLLLVSGPRTAEVLGLSASQVSASLLGFVTLGKNCQALAETLSMLRQALSDKGLPVGHFSVLGFTATDVAIDLVPDDTSSHFLGITSGPNRFASLEPDTDPRPLYFIPYDPDIDQSSSERQFCKRVLFERIQAAILAAIGRAYPPAELPFEARRLLNDAMFGMYDLWESSESRKHMRALCRQFMAALSQGVNSAVPRSIVFEEGKGWIVNLTDEKQHEAVKDALERFSCESLDLEVKPDPDLFDNGDNNGSKDRGK